VAWSLLVSRDNEQRRIKLEPGVIAGTISTSIFMLSQVPMLLKAARTRSLSSYTFTQIMMNTGANLIHWCYISSLPFGPIYFLHGFSTMSTALMFFDTSGMREEKTVMNDFDFNDFEFAIDKVARSNIRTSDEKAE
jgi:hypothetical protein